MPIEAGTNNYPELGEIYHNNGKHYRVDKIQDSCSSCCFKGMDTCLKNRVRCYTKDALELGPGYNFVFTEIEKP
jgi:hypothetical protein